MIAALMPVFKETYENAVPVLIQGDRYLYTVTNESAIESFAYLLGAFKLNNRIIPVQFELKHDRGKNTSIYVVATIKEDVLKVTPRDVDGSATPTSSSKEDVIKAIPTAISDLITPTSSFTTSIEDVIANVNPNDTRILANIPAQFLTEEQKRGKRKGLEEKGAYLRDKAMENGRILKRGECHVL